MTVRRFGSFVIAVACLAVASSLGDAISALAGASKGGGALAPFSGTLHPNGPKETCPEHTKSLPADALAGAVTDALAEAPKLFAHAKLQGMRVDAASARDSAHARVKCGATVQAHTVTIRLTLPAYAPSASLQQHTLLVARFTRGYRVWYVLH